MAPMEVFKARGHPNIRASHRTTLMVTKEEDITVRGDCIVAVAAEKGLRELDPRVRGSMRREGARICLLLEAGPFIFKVSGFGDPSLSLSHPKDMVVRKGEYICERTLMIRADKAARDIPEPLLRLLQNGDQVVSLRLIVEDEELRMDNIKGMKTDIGDKAPSPDPFTIL